MDFHIYGFFFSEYSKSLKKYFLSNYSQAVKQRRQHLHRFWDKDWKCALVQVGTARLDFPQLKGNNGAANSKEWMNSDDLYLTIESIVCFSTMF